MKISKFSNLVLVGGLSIALVVIAQAANCQTKFVGAPTSTVSQISKLDLGSDSAGGAVPGVENDFWIGTNSGTLSNISLNGQLLFSTNLEGEIIMRPGVMHNGPKRGSVIVGTDTGHLYEISRDRKVHEYKLPLNDEFLYDPLVHPDGSICFVGEAGYVFYLDANLKFLSEVNLVPDSIINVFSESALSSDGFVAIPVEESKSIEGKTITFHRVYFTALGKKTYFYEAKSQVSTKIMSLPNGNIAVATDDQKLHILNCASALDVIPPIALEERVETGGVVLRNGFLALPLENGRTVQVNYRTGVTGVVYQELSIASGDLAAMADPTQPMDSPGISKKQIIVTTLLGNSITYHNDDGTLRGSIDLPGGDATTPAIINGLTVVSNRSLSVFILRLNSETTVK